MTCDKSINTTWAGTGRNKGEATMTTQMIQAEFLKPGNIIARDVGLEIVINITSAGRMLDVTVEPFSTIASDYATTTRRISRRTMVEVAK